MSSGSTEWQYGLRHVNGVTVWDGDILTLRDCETAALWFRVGLKPVEKECAVARLWANLQGPAKEMVRTCKPQDSEDAHGFMRLLSILRDSPLSSMPVPDAIKKIHAYDQIRRRPSEVIGDFIVREQRAVREMTEALRRVRNSRAEKTGARRRGHPVPTGNSSVHSDAAHEMVEDEDLFTEAPWQDRSDFLLVGDSRMPPTAKCTSLTRRATDGCCWNKKRHGVHSWCDTAASRLGRPRPP